MELAISEPYFYGLHGGDKSIPQFMVVYGYTLDEFYNNEWRDELKCVVKNTRRRVASLYLDHDLLRNYKELIRLNKIIKLNLVQIVVENERELCILHTYKLNIFKRKWRNLHRQA
jgi:hypothetical protein